MTQFLVWTCHVFVAISIVRKSLLIFLHYLKSTWLFLFLFLNQIPNDSQLDLCFSRLSALRIQLRKIYQTTNCNYPNNEQISWWPIPCWKATQTWIIQIIWSSFHAMFFVLSFFMNINKLSDFFVLFCK